MDMDDELGEGSLPAAASAGPPASCSVSSAFLRATERLFRDAHDQGMYSGDYITKSNPIVGDVLHEQAVGVERYEKEREDRRKKQKLDARR